MIGWQSWPPASAGRRRDYRVAPLQAARLIWRPIDHSAAILAVRRWNAAALLDISGCGLGLRIDAESASKLSLGTSVQVRLQRAGANSIVALGTVERLHQDTTDERGVTVGLRLDCCREDPKATHPEISALAAMYEREQLRMARGGAITPGMLDINNASPLLKGNYRSDAPRGR